MKKSKVQPQDNYCAMELSDFIKALKKYNKELEKKDQKRSKKT